jgi:hypothetical protein
MLHTHDTCRQRGADATSGRPLWTRSAMAIFSPLFFGSLATVLSGAELDVRVTTDAGAQSIVVLPGDLVSYEVHCVLSDADNLGLARVLLDLAFDGGTLSAVDSPSTFPMLNFDVPLGLTNPGGFGGTVVDGDLLQVGGAQNTMNNPGTSVPVPNGEVITGVGQSEFVLASGSVIAPATGGTYTLRVGGMSASVIRKGETGDVFWTSDPIKAGSVSTLTVIVQGIAPSAAIAEPVPTNKDRFVSFVVPTEGTGAETALQVVLSSLYDPGVPVPMNPPDFSAREGEVRFVNLLRDGAGVPVTSCLSSPAFLTFYRCATLGCEPEYTDWASLFGGETVHLSGSAVLPDSSYRISQLASSCSGNEAACAAVSDELELTTARFGDADHNDLVNVADIVITVDVVKATAGAAWEYQVYGRSESPAPHNESTNVTDIVLHVDAVKLVAYGLSVQTCP